MVHGGVRFLEAQMLNLDHGSAGSWQGRVVGGGSPERWGIAKSDVELWAMGVLDHHSTRSVRVNIGSW